MKPRIIRDGDVWECALGNFYIVRQRHVTGEGRTPLEAFRAWYRAEPALEPRDAGAWSRSREGHFIIETKLFE